MTSCWYSLSLSLSLSLSVCLSLSLFLSLSLSLNFSLNFSLFLLLTLTHHTRIEDKEVEKRGRVWDGKSEGGWEGGEGQAKAEEEAGVVAARVARRAC